MLLAREQPFPQWVNDLLAMVPWIIIFLFLWFFIYRYIRKEKHRQEELEAAKAHAAALQKRLDQLSGSTPPTDRGG